jgi:hypothetical protein
MTPQSVLTLIWVIPATEHAHAQTYSLPAI